MHLLFSRPPDDPGGKARPPEMEPTIRVIRGHHVYRRPERCPRCRGWTYLYLTGTPGVGFEVWSWLDPHPRCVIGAILDRVPVAPLRRRQLSRSGGAVPLGEVRIARSIAGRAGEVRAVLDAHRRGYFGIYGGPVPDPEGFDGWCLGLYPVATRNALAVAAGAGLVWSRTPDAPGRPGLVCLTALGGGEPSTLVMPSCVVVVPSPDGLPDLSGRDPRESLAGRRRRQVAVGLDATLIARLGAGPAP